jgi:hypothetical protein
VSRSVSRVAQCLVLLALLLLPSSAGATTFRLMAILNGSQQVPPTRSNSFGIAFVDFDDATGQLRISLTLGLSPLTLQGAQTAAHIQGPALPGQNGPILFDLPLGSFGGINRPTFTLTSAQGADLLAGRLYVNIRTTAFPEGEIRGQIGQALPLAAVLPASRSVQVGVPATAFATIANLGPGTATGCGIALDTAIPATLTFQTTNPATNTVTGTPNSPVDVLAGETRSFVFAITPSAPMPPTEVRLRFACSSAPPAPAITGVNTLLLSASAAPAPDVIAIGLPPPPPQFFFSNPGALTLDPAGQGAFAVAAVNVGAGATMTVTADGGGASPPLATTLCQTSFSTGACLTPPAAAVTVTMPTDAAIGLAVFVTGTERIVFNPALNRIFVRFADGGGVIRGSTSLAVTSP